MSDLEDPLYKDWVRSSLGLKYLKEGLCNFVDRLAKQHHANLLQSYIKGTGKPAVECSECTSENLLPDHPRHRCIQKFRSKCFCNKPNGRRKCPNNFCSWFYDQIVLAHDERNPLWCNTDPKRWYKDHWEMAKSFLATTGHIDKRTAADIDVTGLLSIMLNDIEIRNHISCIDNVAKARDVRNEIMHTKSFQVDRKSFHQNIDQMISVLQDSKVLIHDAAAQNAVAKLKKVEKDQIHISMDDVTEMRRHALKAIEEVKDEAIQQIEIKESTINDSLDSKHKCHLEEQEKIAENISRTIEKAKVEFESRHSTALNEIEEKEKESKENIDAYAEEIKLKREFQPKISADTLSEEYMLTEDEKDLQRYLLEFYQNEYVDMPISPLSRKETRNIEELYVPLKARIIYGDIDEKVTNLSDFFQHRNGCFQTIYLTGDAGIGKSTFCTKLISLWCISKQTPREKTYRYAPVFNFENETYTENNHGGNQDFDMNDNLFFFDSDGEIETSSIEDSDINDQDVSTDDTGQTSSNEDAKKIECTYSSLTEERNHFNNDIEAIQRFLFLFFISLRHTRQEISIEDMIKKQLLFQDSKRVDTFKCIMDRIPQKCLIILDGLDEWTPPTPLPIHPTVAKGLPISSVFGKYVKLFTSRRWKYENISPKIKENESEVRLAGIGKKASMKLIDNILAVSDETNSSEQIFTYAVNCSDTSDLLSIPLILKLIICLWQTESKLESSRTELYTSIINLMLRLSTDRNGLEKTEKTTFKLPQIFEEYCYFEYYANFLGALSKFAFNCLLKKPSGSIIVFTDIDLSKYGLNKEQIRLSRCMGLLTQKSISNRLLSIPEMSFSFVHKSFQEFFAALNICINEDEKDVIKNVISRRFEEKEDVLEVTSVLHFLADLRQDLFQDILKHMASHSSMNTKITWKDSVLTLCLKKEDKYLIDLFLMGNPRTVTIDFTNFETNGFKFRRQNNQLRVVELKSVGLTHRALTELLESIPETENGVEVTLENIGWENEHLEDKNSIIDVDIQNVNRLRIRFTDLTKLELYLTYNIKRVELDNINITATCFCRMVNYVLKTKENFELTSNCIDLRKCSHCFTDCRLLKLAFNPDTESLKIDSLSICMNNMFQSHSDHCAPFKKIAIKDTDLMCDSLVSMNLDCILLVNVKITLETIDKLIGEFDENIKPISKQIRKEASIQEIHFFITNKSFIIFSYIPSVKIRTNIPFFGCIKLICGQDCFRQIFDDCMGHLVNAKHPIQKIRFVVHVFVENKHSETGYVSNLLWESVCTKEIIRNMSCLEIITYYEITSLKETDMLALMKDNFRPFVGCEDSTTYLDFDDMEMICLKSDVTTSIIEILYGLKISTDFLLELFCRNIIVKINSNTSTFNSGSTTLFGSHTISLDNDLVRGDNRMEFKESIHFIHITSIGDIFTKGFKKIINLFKSWQAKK